MSFSTNLAKRNLALSVAAASAVSTLAEDVHSFESFNADLDGLLKDIDQAVACCESLSVVNEEFTTQDVFTKETVQEYQDKVALILGENELTLPLDTVSITTESMNHYSDIALESKERVMAILKRAADFVTNLLKKIWESITSIVGKLDKVRASSAARLKSIGARLKKKFSDAEPSTEANEGGVRVKDVQLIGSGGPSAIGVVHTAQNNARRAGVETLNMLRKTMDVFKGFKVGEDDHYELAHEFVYRLAAALGLSKSDAGFDRKFPIGPGVAVSVTITMNEEQASRGLMLAKVQTDREPAKPGSLPGMPPKACEQLLADLVKSLSELEAMKKPMDDAAKVFRQISDRMNYAYKEHFRSMQDNPDAEQVSAASKTARIYSIYSSILAQLGRLPRENLSAYMLTHWALEEYLDGCVDLLEGKKRKAA